MKQVRFSVDGIVLTCRHTRDFSSRYCSILAPSMAPRLLKWMSMYFPKRLELSLRMVFALPKAYWTKTIRWGGSQIEMMQFVMHFSCTITDLPEWAWPPGPAALSRSVGRWWLPGTAGSAWCSPSFQLQTRRWNTKQNETKMKEKLLNAGCLCTGSFKTWWCSTGPCCCAACWSSSCRRLQICAAASRRSSCWCRGGSDPQCRWGAAGRGWPPPGWSRCTSTGSTNTEQRAVKCHSPVSPWTCRHFRDVWFDSNYEMLVSHMAGYFIDQSSLFQNVKKPNYAGKSKKQI